MKIITVIPPLLACIATGWVLLHQRSEIRLREAERNALEGTLTLARSNGINAPLAFSSQTPNPGEITRPGTAIVATSATETIKPTLAELIAVTNAQQGVPNFKAMVKMQAGFDAMTAQELGALLAEANGAELEKSTKTQIENQLLDAMSDKDPKLALEAGSLLLSTEDANSGMRRFHLRGAFEKWAAKNATDAASWLDEKISSGQLENKSLTGSNQDRIHYESALIARQATETPDLAIKRVANLTAEERKAVFQQTWGFPITPDGRQHYISLVRGSLEPAEQQDALRNYAAQLTNRGKLEDVTDFLSKASPSAKESNVIVSRSALEHLQNKVMVGNDTEELTSDAAAQWRDWVVKAAPENATAIIGKSIGEMREVKASPEELEAAFQKLSPPGGTDAVKVAYLTSQIRYSSGLRQVAESITDPGLREQAIKNLRNPDK